MTGTQKTTSTICQHNALPARLCVEVCPFHCFAMCPRPFSSSHGRPTYPDIHTMVQEATLSVPCLCPHAIKLTHLKHSLVHTHSLTHTHTYISTHTFTLRHKRTPPPFHTRSLPTGNSSGDGPGDGHQQKRVRQAHPPQDL